MNTSSSSTKTELSRLSLLSVLMLTLGCCAFPSSALAQPDSPAVGAPAQANATAQPQPPLSVPAEITPDAVSAANEQLWSRLREGTGYVVLLRHAQTVPGTGDPPGFRLEDCATQRNLSAAGREQAVRIGQVFKRQGISGVQVLSSQYCRCLETAKLMDIGTVESAPMLNSIFEDRSAADMQLQKVNQQILNHRGKTGVMVMVTHYANISAVSGIAPQPGGAVVLRSDEQGAIAVVGQLKGI